MRAIIRYMHVSDAWRQTGDYQPSTMSFSRLTDLNSSTKDCNIAGVILKLQFQCAKKADLKEQTYF